MLWCRLGRCTVYKPALDFAAVPPLSLTMAGARTYRRGSGGFGRRASGWLGPALACACVLLTGYFGAHAMTGHHGYIALQDMRAKQDALQGQLRLLREESERWESRVLLLQSHRIDPDMLDESVRAELGFAHPDDLIIYRQ